MRRSLLLLEVLVGLALLALLGVSLLCIRSGALRQFHAAQRRSEIAQRVESLLWYWSVRGEPVTLPGTGRFTDALAWKRQVQPVRIDAGVIVTEITLLVRDEGTTPVRDVYRAAWLVSRKPPERR